MMAGIALATRRRSAVLRRSLILALILSCAAPIRAEDAAGTPLGALTSFDDGLAEMCYYKATDQIYGEQRVYTRVHILNRQWMDPASGVKAMPQDPGATAVFKFNVTEEIPTENYNYRYLTTVFLKRPSLEPFKMAASSQEWCGTTYKHLRWSPDALHVRSFSYFEHEGEHEWKVDPEAVPFEALFLIARDVAATRAARSLTVLEPMRSNREVVPVPHQARLVPGAVSDLKVAGMTSHAMKVELECAALPATFYVDIRPPYVLVKYEAGALRGEITHFEKRAYWDRSKPSRVHAPGKAP